MSPLSDRVPAEFWPTIDKIDEVLEKLGMPGIRKFLEETGVFDPDAISAVIPAWGADGAGGLPDLMSETLRERVGFVRTMVGQRWDGEAWEAFDGDMAHVEGLLGQIGEPARIVGDQLKEFVEQMEVSWLEIIGIVLEAAGLVATVVGIIAAAVGTATAAPSYGVGVIVAAIGWVTAIAGLIISILGLMVTYAQSVVPRIEANNETMRVLFGQMIKLKPLDRGGPYETPPTDDWNRKTLDPNT